MFRSIDKFVSQQDVAQKFRCLYILSTSKSKETK